jgi:DNA polymerase delta subunit 2
MLEDESGRIKLVGDRVSEERLVTGVIVAALGMETPAGDFEVVDMCTAGLAIFAEEEILRSDSMDVDME